MGFVSFEVEKMRMFLVQSVVRWYWVLVRSWGPFPCETTDQSMVPISAGQLAEGCGQQAPQCSSCTGMEELPSLSCYKFFFYSKFWATDAVFFKV